MRQILPTTWKGVKIVKTSIKVLSVLLTFVLFVGMLGIRAVARGPFDCEMMLTPYSSLENVMISVTTNKAAGAVTGTLTFDSSLVSFDPAHTKCYEAGVSAADLYTVEGNTITFVVVADDLVNGQTKWIDFAFVAKGAGTANFAMTKAQASDVGENLSDATDVVSVNKAVSIGPLVVLGASYRPESESANGAALRFGTKLYCDKDSSKIIVDGVEKTAVYCGYILGFEANIKLKNSTDRVPELGAIDFDRTNGKFTKVTAGAIMVNAQKALVIEEDYLVYTVAVTGITSDSRATIGGVENVQIQNAPLVARPYIVYLNEDNTYGIYFGEQITRTFSEVEEMYSRVEG